MCCRICKRLSLLNRRYHIAQLCRNAKLLLQCRLENVKICIFEIFTEKLGRNLDLKRRFFECHRPDRLEPHGELLWIDVLPYEIEAIVPNQYMSFRCHQSDFVKFQMLFSNAVTKMRKKK